MFEFVFYLFDIANGTCFEENTALYLAYDEISCFLCALSVSLHSLNLLSAIWSAHWVCKHKARVIHRKLLKWWSCVSFVDCWVDPIKSQFTLLFSVPKWLFINNGIICFWYSRFRRTIFCFVFVCYDIICFWYSRYRRTIFCFVFVCCEPTIWSWLLGL